MPRPPAALLFPGQGSQYVGMGKDLYESFKEARLIYDTAADVLGFDIRKVCFEGPQATLTQTRFAQPAIFVTSIAAWEVFRQTERFQTFEWKAAAGLSLGEATALVATDALSYKEGLRFVKQRGLFMDEAAAEMPGAMAAVMELGLDAVETICRQTGAEVGNLNCPGQVVISGRREAVEAAVKACEAAGARRVIPLEVSGAFHSSCMKSACRRIEEALQTIVINPPKFSMISNLTGENESDPVQIKKNLVNQMSHRTLWEASMRKMISMGIMDFFELGPGKVLKGLMRKIEPKAVVQPLGNADDFKAISSVSA